MYELKTYYNGVTKTLGYFISEADAFASVTDEENQWVEESTFPTTDVVFQLLYDDKLYSSFETAVPLGEFISYDEAKLAFTKERKRRGLKLMEKTVASSFEEDIDYAGETFVRENERLWIARYEVQGAGL